MTGFSRSPRLAKAGLVLIDPESGAIVRIIALQYNSETLTRSLAGPGGRARKPTAARRCASRGRPSRPSRSRRCSTRPTSSSSPTSNAAAVEAGLFPQIAALETLVHPTSAQLRQQDALASAGTLEIAPIETPLALFIWSRHRIVPVRVTAALDHRGGLRPQPQPDPRQGQPVAAGAVGRRPRLRPPRRRPVHGLPRRQGAAGAARAGRHARDLRRREPAMSNPIEALFGAGLLPKTDFPPESRYHGIAVAHASPGPTARPSPTSPAASCRRPSASPP